MMSLSYPGEHNWLGWSLFFKEIGKPIDIFLNKVSGEDLYLPNEYVYKQLPYEAFYNAQFSNLLKTYTVFPDYIKKGQSKNHYAYTNISEMFTAFNKITNDEGLKVIYSYCGEPDQTMHLTGASSWETKEKIKEINNYVEIFANRNNQSLIIISADHGQIDINEYIELFQDNILKSFLNRPLSLETRAASLSINKENENEFKAYFKNKYKQHTLYNVNELINDNVFGYKQNDRITEFLGDYIAVPPRGIGYLLHKQASKYPGHHGGFTKEEMLVPLIIIGT